MIFDFDILVVFDTRRGSQPVDYTTLEYRHKDAVQRVNWIQSKQSTECVSIATDGQILFWDTRNLLKPIEEHLLTMPANKVNGYEGVVGGTCMHYDTSYSVLSIIY